MIEAPEAKLIAGQLANTFKGKTITEVLAGHTPHKFAWFNVKPEEFPRLLIGKIIEDVSSQGGQIIMTAGDKKLLLSEGINIKYIEPGEPIPSKHQFLIGFDDNSCLTISIRMYGVIYCFEDKITDGLKPYYEAARNKPQVLSDDFTREYFLNLANADEAQKKSSKTFLATEQNIPGLGNGVLQDILYNAGIHPKTKISSLDEDRKNKMYDAVKRTLKEMFEKGGRDSESDIFGNYGQYIPHLSKNTVGSSCVRCGKAIVKENYMGGAIYYCPGCQVLEK